MTTITAKIIADSISPEKIRLITMQLRYPRFIHAELMTHRVFSRNASSSRAVPVERLIEDILRDTATPIHWGKNQKGMQADEECNGLIQLVSKSHGNSTEFIHPTTTAGYTSEEAWVEARDRAIDFATAFAKAGYHKQIVNRLLEPFSHINVLITSTYWANWFKLRDHKDAMPEIQELAKQMKQVKESSTPVLLQPGEWHVPYIVDSDFVPAWREHTDSKNIYDVLLKCSVARCARVSYLTYEGKEPNMAADLKLFERLVGSEPLHSSPAEHQATPDEQWWHSLGSSEWSWKHPKEHGNFYGWRQYRKMLPNEFENEYAS